MEVWISYEYAILWHYAFSSFLSLKAMAFDGVIVLLSVVDLVNDFASGAGLGKWIKHEATELSLIFFANLREGDSIRFHEIDGLRMYPGIKERCENKTQWKRFGISVQMVVVQPSLHYERAGLKLCRPNSIKIVRSCECRWITIVPIVSVLIALMWSDVNWCELIAFP